jgi:hypothetical protein
MAALRQVTFRFPTDTAIRYLDRPPRRGDRVRGVDGELFVVLYAEPTSSGDVAICVTPLEYDRAADLRARAIRAITPSARPPPSGPGATPSSSQARGGSMRA